MHAVKRVRFDHVAERIRARLATAEESRLLNMAKRGAVLNLLLAVYDADDRPLEVVDAVLPGDVHELEDLYPFSPEPPSITRLVKLRPSRYALLDKSSCRQYDWRQKRRSMALQGPIPVEFATVFPRGAFAAGLRAGPGLRRIERWPVRAVQGQGDRPADVGSRGDRR